MSHSVRILAVEPLTQDVRRYRLERPPGYAFEAGQATELSIDIDGYRERKSPFTFTALAEDDDLEFTIKSYFDHDGVTKKLWELVPGDCLLLRDVWGTITYKGPGIFIAGGAGVTPFIAILRRLSRDGKLAGNRLIVSNKTEKDIILREEFEAMEGLDHEWVISNDPASLLYRGHIDEDFLTHKVADFSTRFYLCGPDPMVKQLRETLGRLGAEADAVTWEK